MARLYRPFARSISIFLTTLLFLAPLITRAQSTSRDYKTDFGSVSAWNLQFTLTRSGSGTFVADKQGDTYTWSINESITGNILLNGCSLSGWRLSKVAFWHELRRQLLHRNRLD